VTGWSQKWPLISGAAWSLVFSSPPCSLFFTGIKSPPFYSFICVLCFLQQLCKTIRVPVLWQSAGSTTQLN